MSTVNKHKVRELVGIPQVVSAIITHECTDVSVDFNYTGPKLNAIWPEVLSFFRWTYDTMKSESQVRLFVNGRTAEWKAWAFPQKARTGMTAKELDTGDEGYERAVEQRKQFLESEGWIYFGTVHHHCSASAFQSGTDEENERSQDGLHITVGNIGSKQYDIHYRFYLKRHGIKPKLTNFWDIGNEIAQIPKHLRSMLVPTAPEEIAKRQMGVPPPDDLEFNPVWKENVIDVTPKAVVVSGYSGPVSFHNSGAGYHLTAKRLYTQRVGVWKQDLAKAAFELDSLLQSGKLDLNDVSEMMSITAEMFDDDMWNFIDIMCRNDVKPEDAVMELKEYWAEQAKQEIESASRKGKKGKSVNGPATKQDVLGLSDEDMQRMGYEGGGFYNLGM